MVQSDLFNNTELSETEIDLMKSFLSDIKRKKVKVRITAFFTFFDVIFSSNTTKISHMYHQNLP